MGLESPWIADLAVAVTTGFLTSPSPVQLLSLDRPNELIGTFPLAMIPVFLVPLSLLLHLASLQKLRRVELEMKHGITIESANNEAGERAYKMAK